MSILTGAVIVVGCSAVGFLVAILVVNLRAKSKKPVPVRASRRQVDLPDFQSIPQEATARLNAVYEKAFDALKEMDPKKPTKLIEKSGPAKQTQKTVNRQVLQSMVGPSYNDPNEDSEFLEIPKKFLLLASNIEKSKLLDVSVSELKSMAQKRNKDRYTVSTDELPDYINHRNKLEGSEKVTVAHTPEYLTISSENSVSSKKRSRRVVCQKCGHKWLPLNKKLPKHCPNCHTTTWRKKE